MLRLVFDLKDYKKAKKGTTTLVPRDLWQKLNTKSWHVHDGYARHTYWRKGKFYDIKLHRVVLDFPNTPHIDHKNRDPLDNRRENLRPCFPAENCKNRPTKPKLQEIGKYRGWEAAIGLDYKRCYFGIYKDYDTAQYIINCIKILCLGFMPAWMEAEMIRLERQTLEEMEL